MSNTKLWIYRADTLAYGRSERISGYFSGNFTLITKPKSLDFLLLLYGTLAKLTKEKNYNSHDNKEHYLSAVVFSFAQTRLPCHNLQKICDSRFCNSLCWLVSHANSSQISLVITSFYIIQNKTGCYLELFIFLVTSVTPLDEKNYTRNRVLY